MYYQEGSGGKKLKKTRELQGERFGKVSQGGIRGG